MLEIKAGVGKSGQIEIVIEGITYDLGELRRVVALTGEGTKPIVPQKRKPGEGQMRYLDGSYLPEDEVAEEKFCRENHIA